ncbi:MAG: sugar ABC transporter substrate-binding protein [Beutenbergiaceae bacterium]
MTRKPVGAVALLLAAALALTGCSTSNQAAAEGVSSTTAGGACDPTVERQRTGDEAPPTEKDGQLRIGFSPTAMDTYYQRVLAGVQEQIDVSGGEAAIQLDVQAPTSQSATDDQVRSIESWIAQDYDAIVVALYNESALEPLFQKATDKGIPIFTFNSPIVCSPYVVADIGYDQSEGGRAQAQWIVDTYGDEEKNIAILEGLPGPHTSERMRGFEEVMADHPNFTVVAQQPAGWTRADGLTVTENILQANPDIDILVGLYDEMALGGLEAIKAAGKEGQIDIVGYENIQEANDAIKTGEFVATVDTGAKTVGSNIITTVLEYVRDGQSVPTEVFNDVTVYDSSNIDTFNPDDYVYVPQS